MYVHAHVGVCVCVREREGRIICRSHTLYIHVCTGCVYSRVCCSTFEELFSASKLVEFRHCLSLQHCFFRPGPPNFGISIHDEH